MWGKVRIRKLSESIMCGPVFDQRIPEIQKIIIEIYVLGIGDNE